MHTDYGSIPQAINAWIEQMGKGLTGKKKAAATRKKNRLFLSPQDWEQLESIRTILSVRPLAHATSIPRAYMSSLTHWQELNDITLSLSVDKVPTISMTLPLYKHLETHLVQHKLGARRTEDKYIRSACEKALTKLRQYLTAALESKYILLGAGTLDLL